MISFIVNVKNGIFYSFGSFERTFTFTSIKKEYF